MAKASKKSPEEELRVVLSVLRGELSAAAGRRAGVSEQTVHDWKKAALEGGRDPPRPVRYQARRRQLAAARRETFVERPARRNRVWQVDFSAFETTAEGAWRLCPVVDYAAKPALARPVTATQTAADLLGALTAAVNTAEALLGRPLLEDLTDEATGETAPLVIVSDNGPAMKSTAVARWFAARAHLAHVRTRHRAPPSGSAGSRTTGSGRCSTPANPAGRSSPPSLPANFRSAGFRRSPGGARRLPPRLPPDGRSRSDRR